MSPAALNSPDFMANAQAFRESHGNLDNDGTLACSFIADLNDRSQILQTASAYHPVVVVPPVSVSAVSVRVSQEVLKKIALYRRGTVLAWGLDCVLSG